MKKKYYAVSRGFKTGVFKIWGGSDGAQQQVRGFKDARYKGFSNLTEARNWLRQEKEQPSTHSENYKNAEITAGVDETLIFTDGGALNNPGPGGYGAVLIHKKKRKEISGGFRKTTNNRMELLACIKALQLLKGKQKVRLYTDSQYLVNGINKGWAKKWRSRDWKRNKLERAENSDLWAELLNLTAKHDISFIWVRGHSGVVENERCDSLVREQSAKPTLPPDVSYEDKSTQEPIFRF
jgi:ribonuclease HI